MGIKKLSVGSVGDMCCVYCPYSCGRVRGQKSG